MENNRITTIYPIYNSLVNLLHSILIYTKTGKDDVYNSLFGIIVLDLIINKETMVKNKEGIVYESLMSDDQLENILNYLDIENVDENTNGASIYATIRNKLAHGDYYIDSDYLIFNTSNQKCKVLIKDFVEYYIGLTKKIKCRFKENKFIKHQIADKSLGKFNKLLTTREDILEFLKFLTYKEFILRRSDNEELKSEEKAFFLEVIFSLYNMNNISDYKKSDRQLKEIFNKRGYIVDINNKKLKKLDEEKLLEIDDIVKNYNEFYNNDVKYINNILYESGEDIFKLVENDYENYSIKYGLTNLITILQEMLNDKIYNFNDFKNDRQSKDEFYLFGLPIKEIISSIIISLIYFSYCYPLEKIYKSNKIFTLDSNEDFDFSNLDLSEIKPSINKLYDLGIDKYLNDERIELNRYSKKYNEINNKIINKTTQRDNLINIYKKNNDNKKLIKIQELNNEINLMQELFEYNLHAFYNQQGNINELEEYLKDKDINFYNYTIINGIRNAISHGNISIKNITSKELKDIELEFIDYHENDIKFKLNIKLDNLLSLLEQDNISKTNSYIKKKINK